MRFKILVVFGFTLHIYLHLCKATNFHGLFTIIFYSSKATFVAYLKNYIYIYIYINIYIYIYIYYLPVNAIVRLLRPRSGDSQGQRF